MKSKLPKWFLMKMSIEDMYFHAEFIQKNGKIGGPLVTVERGRGRLKLNKRFSVLPDELAPRIGREQYVWNEVFTVPVQVLAALSKA